MSIRFSNPKLLPINVNFSPLKEGACAERRKAHG